MGIDFPPPILPQNSSMAEIRSSGAEFLGITDHGVRFHLHGLRLKDEAPLRAALQDADSASAVIEIIALCYRNENWPAVRVLYAVSDEHDIEIAVLPGRLSAVQAPPELARYFADLVQPAPLQQSALERRRVLADLHADRMGQSYAAELIPQQGSDAAILSLQAQPDSVPSHSLALGFSNAGNRYAGPYLFDVAASNSWRNGLEASISGVSSLQWLGDRGHYQGLAASLSTVLPLGVPGLDYQHAHYLYAIDGSAYLGHYDVLSAHWEVPVYARLAARWSLQLALDQLQQATDASDGTRLQDESNLAFALKLSGAQRPAWTDERLELQSSLQWRQGLHAQQALQSAAKPGYSLLDIQLAAHLALDAKWAAFSQLRWQLADGVLPQQEQFLLGGAETLRAYGTGAAFGDRGQAYRAGLQWNAGDDAVPLSPVIDLFVDYGQTELIHSYSFDNRSRAQASDAGILIKSDALPHTQLSLSLAYPLTESTGDGNELKRETLQFELRTSF